MQLYSKEVQLLENRLEMKQRSKVKVYARPKFPCKTLRIIHNNQGQC